MNLHAGLIDQSITLRCPICDTHYPFDLVKLMGFSLESVVALKVFRLFPVQTYPGETVGAAIVTRYPSISIEETGEHAVVEHPAPAPSYDQ